jgi:hypothetical protein
MRWWLLSVGLVVFFVIGLAAFRDWYPASVLDDRATCSGTGIYGNKGCWGGDWP